MSVTDGQKEGDHADVVTTQVSPVDLSVIVTCTESTGLLPTALGHLEAQTYPAARFEIVVIDESAQGNLHEVVNRFADGAPVRTRCLRGEGGKFSRGNEARNAAIAQAKGHWLLFLDEDLLAGPHLVESHIRAQEAHGGAVAILGRIEHHPQVDQGVLTKWRPDRDSGSWETDHELPFYAWQSFNLSLPRKLVVDVGGFDEDFPFLELDDVELAWRLSSAGTKGYFTAEGCAYAWRPINMAWDRTRHYRMGYSLHTLMQKAPPEKLGDELQIKRPWLDTLTSWAWLPATSLCGRLSRETRCFSFLHKKLQRYELLRGFRDAAAGRAPLPSS